MPGGQVFGLPVLILLPAFAIPQNNWLIGDLSPVTAARLFRILTGFHASPCKLSPPIYLNTKIQSRHSCYNAENREFLKRIIEKSEISGCLA